MAGVASLSPQEVAALELRCDPWTKYVELERRGPWLVVTQVRVLTERGPMREIWSRNEETGKVMYDRFDPESDANIDARNAAISRTGRPAEDS